MKKGKKIRAKLGRRREQYDQDPKKLSAGDHGMTRPGSQNLRKG